jgi:predicted permease
VVRLALGAPRRRLVRQHLIGSMVLAALGGIAGLGLGYLLAQGIHGLFQAGRGAGSVFDLQPGWRTLSYTAALSGVTALVFGLAPALRAGRSDLGHALRIQARSLVDGWLRLPRLLVSTEIALTFAAVVAAGLLGRSLENLNSIDLGFEGENLAYATVNPYQAGYAQEQVGPYLDRLTENLDAIPGVLGVGVVDARPLQGGGRGTWASTPEGPPARLDDGRLNPDAAVNLSLGGSGLMDALRVRVLAGRPLESGDLPQSGVAVVDERFAGVFFNGRNPVGERFEMLGRSIEVIGLAANAHFLELRDPETPTVYMPFDPAQFLPGEVHVAIRAAVGPGQLSAEVGRVVAALDPAVPVTEFHTQGGLINRFLRTERLLAFVSGGFGGVALILAAIGLGGLLTYAVARRTNEIGLRVALGASPSDVVRMVLGELTRVVGLGLLTGLPLVYAVGRLLTASLYELEPLDPLSAGFALAVLLLVALIAAVLPARRAAGIAPITALREE